MHKKILIVFGTRPEVIKLAPIIISLKKHKLKNEVCLVSTSQHEELLHEQLKFWKITPDYFLTSASCNGNLTRLLSHTLNGLQDIIDQIKTIEYIIVQGDTNTALACANIAFLNKIKLVHIEAGLRSFDFKNPFPEEYNRVIVSKTAYFNFATTTLAEKNLIQEGVEKNKIMLVGNTVVDALNIATNKLKKNKSIEKNIVLITFHRRENIDLHYKTLIEIIHDLAIKYPTLKFIWVTHPNCYNKIAENIFSHKNIEISSHISYNKFIGLYNATKMVITDSGGVSEEAIQLGLPIIIFREKTERVEAIDVNYPMIISLKKDKIITFFSKHIHAINKIKYTYGDGETTNKILNWIKNELKTSTYDMVIIGGGPAGTGIVLNALKKGTESKLFTKKIALIEASNALIKGNITKFKIDSDTFSDVFLECLDGEIGRYINLEILSEEIDFIKNFKGKPIPLNQLEKYYNKLGKMLQFVLQQKNLCDFFTNTSANKIAQKKDGTFEIYTNKKNVIHTKKIVIATGANPISLNEKKIEFANKIILNKYNSKIILADELLKKGIPKSFQKQLIHNPKVVILGGSHSAFSAAHFLLQFQKKYQFNTNNINIWCKSLPKIYFNNEEDARSSGYTDFTKKDFCPITKKLYRLAGLRMNGRQLYMDMLGLNSSLKETRVKLNLFENNNKIIEKDIEQATIIIAAYGYEFNIPAFYNEEKKQIKFLGSKTKHWVNESCEVLNEDNYVIPNLYAVGLATGFIPSGNLGGEPSFEGQTNGIWYYQNAIAEKLIDNL